jgi:hypothetical protein
MVYFYDILAKFITIYLMNEQLLRGGKRGD